MADKQIASRGGVPQTYRDNADGSYADEHSSQLRATAVPVTSTDNLSQVGGSAVTLGAKVSASSIPVVVASDQAAIPTYNKNLERDLRELFPTHPKWRVLKNKRTRHAVDLIEAATLELRQETRFA